MDDEQSNVDAAEEQGPVTSPKPPKRTKVAKAVPMRRAKPDYYRHYNDSANHRRQRPLHTPPPPVLSATDETKTICSPPGFSDRTPINLALAFDAHAQSIMALNNNSNPANNMFPPFLESPVTGNNNLGGVPRLAPSPISQQPQHPVNNSNGNGAAMNGMNVGMPMNAGQQMDVNMLYQKVVELSEVLKENREKTQGIVSGAEELATRAAANGANPSLQEANAEITAARIADLERQLAREQNKVRVIIREQKENTKLIGEYETAVGGIVEMVRNYSFNNKNEKTAISRHYNKLLQEEKDAHLAARLEKDDWHAKFMRSVEMLREAYKIRCEEEDIPVRIVSGLQNEVRAYRNALGMEPEKAEDEYGYEILKDIVDRGGD
ncbi:hypothetical protein MMC07_001216 [Pseudocyphellaria aurata]|nr:hypothetical protein [Pseudocyphellaria aurata]